jgi:hypothetical protein
VGLSKGNLKREIYSHDLPHQKVTEISDKQPGDASYILTNTRMSHNPKVGNGKKV